MIKGICGMSAITIQQMADRVAALLQERMGLRGQGLAAKLKSGGRTVPQRVREAGMRLARAAEMAQNPKLLLQIDMEKVAADYDVCVRQLGALNAGARRRAFLAGTATRIALSLLVLGVLVALFVYWRGLV
jgi:hypothetical protein